MEWSIRTLDRGELPGFRSYLLPETARRADGLLVLGAVTGRSACGAAAVRRSGTSAELTDLFVDASVRRRGAGRALLEELIRRLEAEGVTRLSADYVLRGEELAAMDHLLDTCGFSAPQRRSRVFRVPSERFHDDPRLGAAFSPQYRSPSGVCALGEVSAAALEELWTPAEARVLTQLGERGAPWCLSHLEEPGGFRLLPYRAVGVEQGMLLCFTADSAAVGGKNLGPTTVALSPTAVSSEGGYAALWSGKEGGTSYAP